MSPSDSSASSSFFSSAFSSAGAAPPDEAAAAPPDEAAPPDGTDPSFDDPSAIKSSRDFPDTSERSDSIRASSASIPTVDRSVVMSDADSLGLLRIKVTYLKVIRYRLGRGVGMLRVLS